jgi:hypothetical protein
MQQPETITDLTEMAYVLVKSKGKNKRNEGYTCGVKKAQVEYMAQRLSEYIGEETDQVRKGDFVAP